MHQVLYINNNNSTLHTLSDKLDVVSVAYGLAISLECEETNINIYLQFVSDLLTF